MSKSENSTETPDSSSSLSVQRTDANWNNILAMVILALVFVANITTPIYSLEYFSSLTQGNWISVNNKLPTEYLWAKSATSFSWADTGWLFNLGLIVIEETFADRGLLVVKFLLLTGIFFANYYLMSGRTNNRFLSFLITALVFCGVCVDADLNAQLVSWLLFPLGLALAFRCVESGSILHWVLLSCYALLAANTSDVSLFVVFSVLVFVSSATNYRRKLFALAVLLGAQFFSPYFGAQLLSSLRSFFNELYFNLILQQQPASIFDYKVGFLLILLLLFANLYQRGSQTLTLPQSFLFAALCLLAFAAKSYLPWALMIAGLSLALASQKLDVANNQLLKGIFELRSRVMGIYSLSPVGVSFFLLCVVIVDCNGLLVNPVFAKFVPVKEVDALLEQNAPGVVLTSTDAAPYLKFRFSVARNDTSLMLFADEHTKELNPKAASVVESVITLRPNWKKLLQDNEIKTVVIRNTEPLYYALANDPTWTRYLSKEEESVGAKQEQLENVSGIYWVTFQRNSF